MKHLIAISLLILCASAQAEEAAPEAPSPWRLTLSPGYIFGAKSDYTIKASNGAALGSSSDQGKASVQVGAEATYKLPHGPVAFALAAEWNKYIYSDGTPDDSQFAVFAIPRLEKVTGSLRLWAGFGLGLMFTSIGQTSSTASGVTATLQSSGMTTASISPRAGIDWLLSDSTAVGLGLSYTTTSGTIDGTVTDGTNTAPFKGDISRSWFATSLRLTFGL